MKTWKNEGYGLLGNCFERQIYFSILIEGIRYLEDKSSYWGGIYTNIGMEKIHFGL